MSTETAEFELRTMLKEAHYVNDELRRMLEKAEAEIERLRAIVNAQRLAIAAAARTLAAVDNDWP